VRLYYVDAKRDTMPNELRREGTPGREGLSALYVRHAADGIRLAYLLTGDRELAEDLVQEAFARVIGRLGHLRVADAFGAYFRRTIVNLANSHFRRRRIERAYLDREAAHRTTHQATNPNDDLDAAIHAALLRLPARQRAAMVLRFYEDMSDEQVAEALRCSAGTARSLISRGLAALRIELEGTKR